MLIEIGVFDLDYARLEYLPAQELIRWAMDTFGDKFAIVTSFQAGGMVITDMAARVSTSVRIITLDTGRLPEETHQMMETVHSHYGIRVEPVLPDPAEVEAMVSRYGANLFYREVPLRTLCCEVRKVRPLERKLKEFQAWATGLRRSQSDTRVEFRKVEEKDGRLKLNPLVDWTNTEINEYVRRHDVPQHPLYAKGYTSIGCAPCTRATRAGEGDRAGRWWWEEDAHKECGIHFSPNGAVRRNLDIPLEVLTTTNA